MIKLVTVVGARPQFIKAATVSRAIRGRSEVRELIVHTGQHYDANMSDVFFSELDIPEPDYHLGIGGGPHGEMTGRQLEAIEKLLLKERPDWVLVYGDTNSTLAGALAAVKLHIPVAHVEAGLRSFNRRMPEEINRVLTDHVADLLFAPTQVAVANLAREGVDPGRVRMVGDVMFEAALFYAEKAARTSRIVSTMGLEPKGFWLATLHRQENTDDAARLGSILQGLAATGATIVLPLHPRTRERIGRFGLAVPGNVRLTDPVGYLDMVNLEANAALVMTDSGGVQKEAFFHRVPCVTLRDETEWLELVEHGANRLLDVTSRKQWETKPKEALAARVDWSAPLYGSGATAPGIVDALAKR